MARNREFVNTTPPQSSDEEDDDDTSSVGISETDSDASIKTPVKTQPPKEGEEEDDDESGSETDSGSDSDSPAKPLVEEARMVSSKRPAEHSSASKELKKMKKAEDYSSAAIAKELKKTKAGDAEADAAEKTKSFMKKIDESEKKSLTKKADEVGPSEKKSNLFQRLWSEDDELVILQGMIEYTEKKGDPSADIGAFLDFIKEKLHVDVSKMQLQDKMRRLKKKFLNKAKQGEERTFSKLHERTSYELSRRIWKEADLPKLSAAERDLMNGKGEPGGGSGSVGRTTDESMLRMGQEWMGVTEEWDLLREEELEASMNQLKVRVRQYERVLSHMRSKRRNRLG